jgi:hypothetical protein
MIALTFFVYHGGFKYQVQKVRRNVASLTFRAFDADDGRPNCGLK